MANPFFSGRIPPDLYQRVEEFAAETNQSKTRILILALSAYLDHPIACLVESSEEIPF
jgi:predicted transcriptional regulator